MSELDKQLIEASEKGRLDVVKYLVENGADIHAQDDCALRWSAERGHLEVVRLLLENGADVHTRNNYALGWSAYYGNFEVVRLLLENGADVHANDDYALRWSAENGHLEVVRLLLENGAKQSELFEVWNKQRIMKEFLEIENCKPEKRHTNELCSDSFKLPKSGDWYVAWEDDSITILENVHLVSVEPEIVKGVYIQC